MSRYSKKPPYLHLRRESDLQIGMGSSARVEAMLRRLAWGALGVFANSPAEKEWILFQFYHWVLDDQRQAFGRQLRFLRRFADFLSLDDAVAAMRSPSGIGGRYLCVTFDDGFESCISNAAPILKELSVPATFFVATKYLGLDLVCDWDAIAPFYRQSWLKYPGVFEFMDWDDCRELVKAGFTIGSHTHSHTRLTSLSNADAEGDLRLSKERIEAQLGVPCRHFCVPWGKLHRDFDPAVHPEMARKLGYSSFLTAEEGLTLAGDSPFLVRRYGCDPGLHPLMLRYSVFPPFERSRPKLVGAGPSPGGSKIDISEPEPVQLEKFPYPYRAAFTVASDIDSGSIGRFRAIHALFRGSGLIKENSPEWNELGLTPNHPRFEKENRGIRGFGFDLADSFFLVRDDTTFGMYQYVLAKDRFQEDEQEGENCADLVRQWLREGQIDTFHTFLHYTRRQVEPLLMEFYQWCERENVAKPRVWINHSAGVTPSGLCPDELQTNRLCGLGRLTARALVGSLFGRKPIPLRHALVRYRGDSPASPYYVNDLLAANGLRYVWLNTNDLHCNRPILPEGQLNGRSTILHPVTMDDGLRYYWFERCYGRPIDQRGEAYLRDSKEGIDASHLITDNNLAELYNSKGTCILYTHWTHYRSIPLAAETLARFQVLQRWRDAGKIWVAPTSRLLEWTRRRTFLRFTVRREGKRLIADIEGVDDPIFGRETVSLSDLDGLCLSTPPLSPDLTVAIQGKVLHPDQLQRSGNLCWLDAKGSSKPASRERLVRT